MSDELLRLTSRGRLEPLGGCEGLHLIGGRWESAGEHWFESSSKVDGEVLCRAPEADRDTVDRAVAAARHALVSSDWSTRRAADRAEILLRWADRLEENGDALACLLAHEVGMPYWLGRRGEVADAADKLRYFAGAARQISGQVTGASPSDVLDLTVPSPVGVCVSITPWNNPLEQPARQLGAALAAGCTVVVKPSERTPLSTQAFVRLADGIDGLPPGVVNLVHGRGTPTGEELTVHPAVDKVAFTGSTATGRRILRESSPAYKRVSIEAGGKTPCLVFRDADMGKALDSLSHGAFLYTGQSCSAATRVIVEDDVYEPFVAGLVNRAKALRVGNPLSPETQIGPVICQSHADKIKDYLDGVAADGGQILAGGKIDGLLVCPTVVVDARPDSRIATEEVFGPVVCVFRVADEDAAVALANAVPFGLQASVWTQDVSRAMRVARRLEFGDVWVNTHYVRQAETPYGGWKQSGMGRELGQAGVEEYLRYQRIAIDRRPSDHLAEFLNSGQ